MYNEALKTETKNITVLTSYGECQAKTKNIKGAIQTFEQVVLLSPKAVKEYKTLGDLKMQINKKAEAMKSYKKYLKKNPSDYAVTKTIGLYEYEKKQHENAIKYLGMVKDDKLMDEEYSVALGLSYYKVKNYKKAVSVFVKARAKKPSVPTLKLILKPLGGGYQKIGKKQQAAEAYDAYTKIAGVKDAEVYYLKAYLIEDTDKATAIKMYEDNTKLFPNDHRSFLQLGLIYAKDRAILSKAISMLNKAAALGAKDPIIWKKLGMAYGVLKNDDKELAAYKKLLTLEPQNLEANRRVGFILLKQKKYTEAITNLEIVSAMAPKDAEIKELLADGYMKTKRPEKAVGLLTSAKALKPNKVEIRTKLIEALAAAGKKDMIPKETDQLIELDKKIVSKDKKNVESRERLSDYLFDKKNYKGAYPIYKELTILLPKEKKSYKRLYEITLKLNKKKESTTYLKQYLALDQKNAKAHVNLAKLLYDQGDQDGALASYRTAFKLDPKMKGVYGQYGSILVKKGLKDEAVKVLNEVIASGEADAKTYEVLGGIYQGKKQYASAVKMYKKASDADPKNSKVLSSLADCQAKSGNINGAILTYEQVVLINPNAKAEYKALGDLQMQVKKKEDAIKTYKKYLEKVPGDSEISRKVGLNMYGKKKYSDVIKFLEAVKDAKLHTNTYLLALGQSYYHTEKYTKAANIFEKLRKRKISEDVQKEILKPLAECYEKTGYKTKAAEAYLAYSKIPGVKDPDASFKRAYLVEKTEKNKAISLYESNIKAFPKDYRSFKRLGLLYAMDKATLSKAAPMLNSASLIKPDDEKILEMLGKIYNKLNNDNKELATYKKLLKVKPQHINANRRVGLILLKQKKYKEAVINLEIVSTMEPNNFELMLSLSECYIETKRHENAIKLLAKAKKIKKNDVDIGRLLYKLYKETGDVKKAETEIKELIAITKDNNLRVVYANDLIDQKRFDEASTIIKQVKSADPTNVESLMLLGKVQQAQNKLSEATETYKMISYIKENYAPALYERGNIYLKQNKTERAKSLFDKAVKADSKYALGYLGLARVAKAQKKNALYAKHLKKAKTLDPRNKEILAEGKK
jgi:tetratricopeptide (TPR) repeat protein